MEKARKGMIGIYQIENAKTGEKYVGGSASINNRLKKHMTDLSLGLHLNRKLQESWNTHGPSVFRFSILEIIDDKYLLQERELFWIQSTGALNIGFNVKSDQWKRRTLISIDMSTKKSLEALKMGSMNATIQKLLYMHAAHDHKDDKVDIKVS